MGRCTLTIKAVESDDAGEWMAKIDDENFTTCVVYVEEPLFKFVSVLKSQKVQERETATLECDVNDKDCDVEWFHDNVKITVITTAIQ